MKFKVVPLGGAGRDMAKIVDAILRYLQPRDTQPSALTPHQPSPPDDTRDGAANYYADAGDEKGRWLGRGAVAMGLNGDVERDDFGAVLAGRHPRTGTRLITAQGSAGRRPTLGVGNPTRLDQDGQALYDPRDAAAALDLPAKHVQRMLDIGTQVALSRLLPMPAEIHNQPAGSYLLPRIDAEGHQWVTDAELTRCQDARATENPADKIAALGRPDDALTTDEAARLSGVTARHLRKIAKEYQDNKQHIDAVLAAGQKPRRAYLPAHKDNKGYWLIRRHNLVAYLHRRTPPAVRVAYDLTLTTEKSLSILAFLSPDTSTRDAVLDSIQAGNDWALRWLEQNAAAARTDDKVVPVNGWTVASFRHYTSRALDPFAHHHNVIANTVEDRHGVRRALDARPLHHLAKAASALATAEMRYQLTTRLGVRWAPSRHGGWEIAGIPDAVLREFSQRRVEIEAALHEFQAALEEGLQPGDIDNISLATRPAKIRALVEELMAGWWQRAEALDFTPGDLADCLGNAPLDETPVPEEELFEALAAPDGGICENVSVFKRGDVLSALVNLPVHPPANDLPGDEHHDVAPNPNHDGGGDQDADTEPQPLIVPAHELERLADEFLRSNHVIEIKPETEEAPALHTTREILAVQDRLVARYRHGLDVGQAIVSTATIDQTLAQHPHLTDEQRHLVHTFCTSGHAIACAIGRAGTGKTTTMTAAADAWRAIGYRVLGAAVKGEAARTLATTTGIPTETLAWYLAHEDPHTAPLDSRTVLIIDEAATVSDRDLDRIGWLADQTGATLRLIGDPAQHGAVESGGMFGVLCKRHPDHTAELTETHRLKDPHDRAAADALRDGRVAEALDHLEAAGHLHIVDDDLQIYIALLSRWWDAHQDGQPHPMVTRDNHTRRQLNSLAHTLLRAHGEIGEREIPASDDRRFAVGDRVIARTPNRHLHTGQRDHYIRNGATGTVIELHSADDPADDQLTIDFDEIGPIAVPRTFFDEHEFAPGHHDVGIDHAYALTSYAVQGATHPMSTSRIDETSTRAETYVDITRGTEANYLYLSRPDDPLDGEHLPRVPPDPIDEAVTDQLEKSDGEKTAWEIWQDTLDRADRGPAHGGGPDLAV